MHWLGGLFRRSPGSVMRLVSFSEADAITQAGALVPSTKWPGARMTRVFQPHDLPRMLRSETFGGRTHLVEMQVRRGWRRPFSRGGARITYDGWAYVVDVGRINSFGM